MNEREISITFGIPEEWKHFSKRHRLFLERFPNLKNALNIAFIRKGKAREPVDRVVFFYGRNCVEDFFQILLLCANGHGHGANALLRGMYERAVTAVYLSEHPDKTDDFLDFYWIAQRRLVNQVKETFGTDALPKDKVEETEANYAKVKDRFKVPICKTCRTTRINHTWTEIDFVSIAKATGALGSLIVPGYAEPTLDSHATVRSLMRQLASNENDSGLKFNDEVDHDKVDGVLITAHNVLLRILDLQQTHFGLDALKEPLQTCVQDFLDVWKKG